MGEIRRENGRYSVYHKGKFIKSFKTLDLAYVYCADSLEEDLKDPCNWSLAAKRTPNVDTKDYVMHVTDLDTGIEYTSRENARAALRLPCVLRTDLPEGKLEICGKRLLLKRHYFDRRIVDLLTDITYDSPRIMADELGVSKTVIERALRKPGPHKLKDGSRIHPRAVGCDLSKSYKRYEGGG